MTMRKQAWHARFLDRKGQLVERHEIDLADAPTLSDAVFQVSCLNCHHRAAKLEIALGDASSGPRGPGTPPSPKALRNPAEDNRPHV